MSLQLMVVQFIIGIASAGAWFWIERKFFGNKQLAAIFEERRVTGSAFFFYAPVEPRPPVLFPLGSSSTVTP